MNLQNARDSSLALRITGRENVGTGRALSEEFLTTDYTDSHRLVIFDTEYAENAERHGLFFK
jgi:hypothetical protein